MLKRINIRGYKSLYDIDLSVPPLAVLIGPNSSGKSNLLDAIQLLAKSASGGPLTDAFAPPHRGTQLESFSFPAGGLDELAEKDRLVFSIEIDLHISDATVESVNRDIHELRRPNCGRGGAGSHVRERDLRYRIEVEMLPQSGVLRIADEYLAALNSDGHPTSRRKPYIEKQGDRIHLRHEGQAHPTHFDRRLDRTVLSTRFYPPHHPHPEAVRRELERWLFFYFEPREHMRRPNPINEVRHIGLLGDNLAAFYRTLEALHPGRFKAINKALRLLLPGADAIDLKVNRLGEVELRIRENGSTVPASVLSEGTLRMLGLLALSGGGPTPSLIGLEEPENGVHPARVRMVADLLKHRTNRGDTQYIVTTHSSLLADMVPHESLLITRRVDGHTQIRPYNDWGPLFKETAIADALAEPKGGRQGSSLPVSERILRGDFDA